MDIDIYAVCMSIYFQHGEGGGWFNQLNCAGFFICSVLGMDKMHVNCNDRVKKPSE